MYELVKLVAIGKKVTKSLPTPLRAPFIRSPSLYCIVPLEAEIIEGSCGTGKTKHEISHVLCARTKRTVYVSEPRPGHFCHIQKHIYDGWGLKMLSGKPIMSYLNFGYIRPLNMVGFSRQWEGEGTEMLIRANTEVTMFCCTLCMKADR